MFYEGVTPLHTCSPRLPVHFQSLWYNMEISCICNVDREDLYMPTKLNDRTPMCCTPPHLLGHNACHSPLFLAAPAPLP